MPTVYFDMGASTATTSSYDIIWNQWQTTSASTSTTDSTWITWVQPAYTVAADQTTITSDSTWTQWNWDYPPQQVYTRTPEEIEAERLAIQEAADKKQKEREEAAKKAKVLLHSLLDQKQKEQLERERFFEFVSQTGKKLRMKLGYARNIDEIGEDGRRIATYCAHPGNWELPTEDHMVAQLLTLKHDEAEFFRRANVSH